MNIEMIPCEIIGFKQDLQVTVDILKNLACVQIDDIADSPQVSARPLTLSHDMLVNQEETNFLLAQVEGLLTALGGDKKPDVEIHGNNSLITSANIDEVAMREAKRYMLRDAPGIVKSLLPSVQTLVSRREGLEAELASLPRYETTLRKLLPIIPDSAREPGKAYICVLINRTHIGVLDLVGKRVLELTGGKAEIIASDVDASLRAMLIVFPQEYISSIENLLAREDVSRLRLPAGLGEGSPDMALAALYRRMATIPVEVKEVQSKLDDLAVQWYEKLFTMRAVLRDEVETYSVFSKFGETDQTFILVGWVPEKLVASVQSALQQELGQKILFQSLELTPELKKRAPVVLQNPAPARPFESLVALLAIPRYGRIDPTRLMAFFLPIFFGMILGDIGYGGILLTICLILLIRMRRHKSASRSIMGDLLIVMAIGSVWAIVFGFLYGEFFGTAGEKLGLQPIWIDRASSEDVSTLLLVSIGVGFIHITLGLILGVWEAVRDHNRNHLFERSGMLLGLISLLVLIGAIQGMIPQTLTAPASIGIIVGILLLGLPMGWLGLFIGPIEFIGLLGNILSYLRIAAIGLASVYLAKVANDVAGIAGSFIGMAIILLLIHGLNLVLGAFSPTIHSLRLHYVEFFRKFYEGGGKPYQPFHSSL
jgi:V/A-type H+/Na+-transporting ATPase subunit I